MDEAAQRQFVADNMDSDLQFVMADSGVSLANQVAVCRHYGSMRKFSAIADDRATLRTVCLHDFAIVQDNPVGRAQTASVVSAWETARETIAKEIEIRAEAKILGQPRILQTHERQAMLRAVEAAYGSMPESETPSNDYLSLKAEETETNEPVASPLDEIVSKKDSSNSAIQSTLDSSGHIRVTRTKNKSKMPGNTEEYRKAMKVEANAWLCMSSRYRAKPWLHGLTGASFSKFVEYILGDRVYNIQLPSTDGESSVRVRPEWSIVLSYEYKLRREVMKLIVNDGMSMHDALGHVTRDADLKESFFTTPLALRAAQAVESPHKFHKGGFKGDNPKGGYKGDFFKGGKGKKGGKTKHNLPKDVAQKLQGLPLAWRTPDGRDLCFAWNTGSCKGSCGRVHQCRVKGCYGDHQAIDHREAVKSA